MKSKLTLRAPAIALAVIVALTVLSPIAAHAADNKTVVTSVTGLPADPTTGLPMPPPWKDPAWKDPDKVLPEISFDGLPLDEVAKTLRDLFTNAFDVLIPSAWRALSESFQVQALFREPGCKKRHRCLFLHAAFR
jgi:hypothetical protein